MSDMVEKVARAIYEARNGRGALPWHQQIKSHKAPYLADARAAIEALVEPTKAMCYAPGDGHATCRRVWQAMISEALNPHTPSKETTE